MLKRLGLLCSLILLSSPSLAADGRISYVTAAGSNANATVMSPVCSVSSDGTPETCANGLSASVSGSGLMSYKAANGMVMAVTPVVPVCSVNSSGVPQICDLSGGSTPDLSAYLTTATAATTYVPVSSLGVASGVATLDASGNVTAPIVSNNAAQTGALQVNGQINVQGIAYFVSSMAQVQGIISGQAQKWTLTRRLQDTYTKLNSYNGSSWSAFAFYDDGSITTNLGTVANLGSPAAFTKTVTAPTPATSDNSTNVATTAFVNTALQGIAGSALGDISASGSSLSLPLGSSGLTLTMSYVSKGTGSLSIASTSGSLSPVDIYETAAWGTTSFKGYVLDSGTVTTTATVIDSTFYLTSNAWGTYHIRVGGSLYVVDVFGSGAGARTTMSWRKIN